MIEIYTTGYSTRSLESWVKMVKKHDIELLVDVRTLGKTTNAANKPEFSKEQLAVSLPEMEVQYHMIPKLGGYRHLADTGIEKKHSPNLGLNKENGFTTDAFRTYADYMYANPEFKEGITELLILASKHKLAYFCCEGWHRRCHRNLISDYLTAFNLAKVRHISSGIRADEHERIEIGKIIDGNLVYPL